MNPEDIDQAALVAQAVDAYRAGDNDGACRLLRQAVEEDRTRESAWLLLSQYTGDLMEKLDAVVTVLDLNPSNMNAWTRLTNIRQEIEPKGGKIWYGEDQANLAMFMLHEVRTKGAYERLRASGGTLPDWIRETLSPLDEEEKIRRLEEAADRYRAESCARRGERRRVLRERELDGSLEDDEAREAVELVEEEDFPAPIKMFKDWVVTTQTIESTVEYYSIGGTYSWLRDEDWEDHIASKGGMYGSYLGFLQALHFAKRYKKGAEQGQGQQARHIHKALGGVMMRSKNEVVIANILTAAGIQFQYEEPLWSDDGTSVLPDFTIHWNRETYYLEHLGLISDPRYLERWEHKWRWYQEHGFASRVLVTSDVEGIDSEEILELLRHRLGIDPAWGHKENSIRRHTSA